MVSEIKNKNWFARHRIITLLILINLFGFFWMIISPSIYLADNSSSSDKPSSSVNQPVQEVYLNKTYNDLFSIFSDDSTYTDLQKENIFNNQYKGRYVKWTGEVYDIDASILDNIRLYTKQRGRGQYDFSGSDAVIYMNKDQYNKLLQLHKGDEVTYSAKLDGFGGFIDTSFYMSDGKIV